MSMIFLKIVNMSIMASWLILAVILIRLLLKKAPRWITCALWALVAVRLLLPFSFESALSIIPSSETIPSNIGIMNEPRIDSGITVINEAVNPFIRETLTPDPISSANPLQIYIPLLSVVWIAGMTAMIIYALLSFIKLKRSVGIAIPIGDNVLACDEVESPFILGVFKPAIYVPSSMTGDNLDYVIQHEKAHLQRYDHWWKPLGFLLLAVYWFNPLCWVAYILLCRDIEIACDEKVIRNMDRDNLAAYSQALLDCSFSRKRIAACPLAFGEVGVKERVKKVLNYKRPAFWIIIAAIIVCIVVAVCFLTNPKNDGHIYETNPASLGKIEKISPIAGTDSVSAELIAEKTQSVEELYEDISSAKTELEADIGNAEDKNNLFQRTYVWEKEGFGGDFTITLYEDGTFQYYVGPLSSHIGIGIWSEKNSVLSLTEETGADYCYLFTFEMKEDRIIFKADESNKFLNVTVEDGDSFLLKDSRDEEVIGSPEPEEMYFAWPYNNIEPPPINPGEIEAEINTCHFDINHDGTPDTIYVSYIVSEDFDGEFTDRLFRNGALGFVKVFDGSDFSNADASPLWTIDYGLAHMGNKQISATTIDGKDYLIITSLWNGQGDSNYRYDVFYFENGNIKVVDSNEMSFKTADKPDLSEFFTSLYQWINSDSVLLIAADIDLDKVYFSRGKTVLNPNVYYSKKKSVPVY